MRHLPADHPRRPHETVLQHLLHERQRLAHATEAPMAPNRTNQAFVQVLRKRVAAKDEVRNPRATNTSGIETTKALEHPRHGLRERTRSRRKRQLARQRPSRVEARNTPQQRPDRGKAPLIRRPRANRSLAQQALH